MCALAETQFRVEVRCLKCVKYELDEISSSVDTLPLCGHDQDYIFWTIGGSAYHPRVFGSGNSFRESDEVIRTLPHHMCVPFLKWLATDYWQPGALLVFTGNLGLLFPKKSVTSVGVDDV